MTHMIEGEDLLYTLPSGHWCVLPHVGPFIRVNVMKNIFKRKENTKLPLVHILFQITEKFRTKIGQTSEAKCVGFCGGES